MYKRLLSYSLGAVRTSLFILVLLQALSATSWVAKHAILENDIISSKVKDTVFPNEELVSSVTRYELNWEPNTSKTLIWLKLKAFEPTLNQIEKYNISTDPKTLSYLQKWHLTITAQASANKNLIPADWLQNIELSKAFINNSTITRNKAKFTKLYFLTNAKFTYVVAEYFSHENTGLFPTVTQARQAK